MLADLPGIGLVHDDHAAFVPDLLFRPFDHPVTLARVGAQHLSGPGDLEPLFSGAFRLQLWHAILTTFTVNRRG